jgi:hypothetical protein
MGNVSAFLDKTVVVLLVINANTIQTWGLQHTNIAVGNVNIVTTTR